MALSGPRLEPRRGPATHLVVLCHGYGADGKDLIELAPHLQKALPGGAFVAPNAPQRCAGAGYQWFPISRIDPHEMHKGVAGAAGLLEAFLQAELARLALTSDRLALVGFSQGTMMALHVGLRGPIRPAAIVGFSGLLTGATPFEDKLPPVLLTHGEEDTVIPPEALFLSAGALGAGGVRVQWHLSRGLAHGIDEASLALAGGFLALAFGGRLASIGEACCVLR
ncbi:MAG: alpha/beta fold hydrolase [Alphaproteobacteria bacterium]|nr:alpha/beta fold hydrolase [Alphaproteobacteria bacterium]MDE2109548.1 alpha/beta fold hydrolase [Alphaproteobacteria bacterium]MDE2493333.1 alpha/beta fold hydrolase [Alphaproteobacteria bacterium]